MIKFRNKHLEKKLSEQTFFFFIKFGEKKIALPLNFLQFNINSSITKYNDI